MNTLESVLTECEKETDPMLFDQIGFALAIAVTAKMMRAYLLDPHPRLKALVMDDQLPELSETQFTSPARAKLALLDWAEREDLLGQLVSKLLRNNY